MLKRIQIGSSDFKELIEGDNYFVNKSLLLKEFIEKDFIDIVGKI